MKKLILMLSLILSTGNAAAESGVAIKRDSLRTKPFQDAPIGASIAAATRAEILQQQGGWWRIKTASGTGWVRMLSIRRDAAATTSSASSLSKLASGRAGTGRVIATTGIRGLNEEQLKAAQYNEAEITLAESYASSATQAAAFAQAGKLRAQKIVYLPATGAAQ